MLLKKATIIMIKGNEESLALEIAGAMVKTFPKGSIVNNEILVDSTRLVKENEIFNEEMGFTRVHLLLVVQTVPVVGDLVLLGENPMIILDTDPKDEEALVVIASTNKTHNKPRFSKGFLEKYAKEDINEAFVVYEENTNGEFIPKTNRNNVISLRKSKSIFTSKEVKDLFSRLINVIKDIGFDEEGINEWIKDNV